MVNLESGPQNVTVEKIQGPTVPLNEGQKKLLVILGQGARFGDAARRLHVPIGSIAHPVESIEGQLLVDNYPDAVIRTALTGEIPVERYVNPDDPRIQNVNKLNPTEVELMELSINNGTNILDLEAQIGRSGSHRNLYQINRKLGTRTRAESAVIYIAHKKKLAPSNSV